MALPGQDSLIINEVLVSHPGIDDTEFVEITGLAGTSLEGLSLIVVEGDAGSVGVIDRRIDFTSADVIGENGFFLLGNPTGLADTFGVIPNAEVANDFLENSSLTIALVETSSLSGAAVTGGEIVLSSVGLTDGDPGDTFYFGADVVGPDGIFMAAGAQWNGAGYDMTDFFGWESLTPTAGTGEAPLSAVINEFVFNHTGSDVNEYIEVLSDPETDLSSLTLLVIEGDSGGIGTIDDVFALGATDADGFWTTGLLANALENGTQTVLLVEDFTGAQGIDLDTDDDGVLDATPWGRIVDSVAVKDSGSSDATFSDTVLEQGFDGVGFTVGGASRIPDGEDTDTPADWVRNDFGLAGIDLSASADVGEALNTPGAANAVAGGPGAPVAVKISEIQGSGDASPLAGLAVSVTAVVTLVSPQLRGFFLQEEDANQDGDAATSEGIFVFTGSSSMDVEVGDLVTVTGIAGEFRSVTQISGDLTIETLATGVPLPSAATISLPLADATDPAAFFETVEGMRVEVVAGDGENLIVTDTYTRFGEFGVTSGEILMQPTQVFESFSEEAEALAEANARDYLLIENGFDDSLSSAPRAGDGIAGNAIEGVMHYTFGDYKVETDGAVVFDPSINPYPRMEEVPDVGGAIQVASFNVLNLFTTLDDGSVTANGSDPRGAETAEELAAQTAKIVEAITSLEAEIVGLVEIENDFLAGSPGNAVEYLVGEINSFLGDEIWAWVDPGQQFVGDDAIANAIIYDTRYVTPLGDAAILDTDEFLAPYTDDPKNRAAIAQTFEEILTGDSLTVAVNHFKSKGSPTNAIVDGEPDDSPVEGSAALTRVAAAEALAEWLASDPTGTGEEDVLILGDLNAYAMERAIMALIDAGYTNLNEAEEFSYQFDGEFGTLDYILANDPMLSQITGADIWNINSLEAYAQQYAAGDFDLFGDLSFFGSSDHDPVLAGVTLTEETFGTAKNDQLRGDDSRDILYSGGGRNDLMWGGANEDTFVFENIEGSRDRLRIKDYEEGVDQIDLQGAEIVRVKELGNHVRIWLEDGDGKDVLYVKGVDEFEAISFVDEFVFSA